MHEIRPDWHHVTANVSSSIGRVCRGDTHTGCGLLIGIDRFLVPAHLVNGLCPSELQISFMLEAEQRCFPLDYPVLQILEINQSQDFCILQLGDLAGKLPGHSLPIPQVSFRAHDDEVLFIHMDSKGYKLASIVKPYANQYGSEHLYSNAITFYGSSGGCYFDASGSFLAMHLARATDQCGLSGHERKAIFAKDIAMRSDFSRVPICTPMQTPSSTSCCAPFADIDPTCFTNEGKPAINNTYGPITYYETFPGNDRGGGPRGIRITFPKERMEVSYKFDPNPHQVSKYNKQQELLYANATATFYQLYTQNNSFPRSFSFEAYGFIFTATYQ